VVVGCRHDIPLVGYRNSGHPIVLKYNIVIMTYLFNSIRRVLQRGTNKNHSRSTLIKFPFPDFSDTTGFNVHHHSSTVFGFIGSGSQRSSPHLR
jgi:hypothetical protein